MELGLTPARDFVTVNNYSDNSDNQCNTDQTMETEKNKPVVACTRAQELHVG